MGRPSIGVAAKTQTLRVRMSEADLVVLDRLRGGRTRSEYVRGLIVHEVDTQPVPVIPPEEPKPKASRLVKLPVPAPAPVSEKRHFHRAQGPKIAPFFQGTTEYAYYMCECGERLGPTRVRS